MKQATFFGRRVALAAFLLAAIGWGIGFYGPPIYLHVVVTRNAWPLSWGAMAVTWHFLCGVAVIACLPGLYRRWGIAWVTWVGSVATSLGVLGWALSAVPWQLSIAATLSGMGWVTMGAAAINAIIAPWFVVHRPRMLGMAYNGASLGGVLFSPLWIWLIDRSGFVTAALSIGVLVIGMVGILSVGVLRHSPQTLGQFPDGLPPQPTESVMPPIEPASAAVPWHDRRLLTLTCGMALGLFAQIGLIAHLFSILVPRLGDQMAGMAMAAMTACAILGRALAGRLAERDIERRLLACMGYALQAVGVMLIAMAGHDVGLIWAGMLLFGSGIGNATSLPPLIAQREFAPPQVGRVVPLIVAIAQGTYAFAPLGLGGIREAGGMTVLLLAVVGIQLLAIVSFASGRIRR